ncbi:MAG TPA: carbohydrate binding family 9 domain-containing protein, partial [Gemmatimonadaceae bacterium]
MITIATALGLALSLQSPAQGRAATDTSAASSHVVAPTDSAATALRATTPPVIDGRDDDEIWRAAAPITGFRQWSPTEGKEPRFRTEAKVAYDAVNLYVFVRAYDPHPDSIIKLLERRDTFTPSDMIWIFVDSYHDRRTGYEFGVNAAGVKIDQAIYDDGNEDVAWDAVWDVATRVDSLGWTAEFRIPLSQMRYSTDRTHTFGLTIDRDIYRYAERVSWPAFSQARAGMVSQFGVLHGMDDLEAPRRIEALPYLVTKDAS